MNELEKQLSELVKKGIEAAEKTGSFVIEQAPELLQEFYRWHLTKNIFLVFTFILLTLLVIYVFKKIGQDEGDTSSYSEDFKLFGKYYDEIGGSALLTISIILIGLFIWGMIHSIYNVIFITVAPKLYLIEYFLN